MKMHTRSGSDEFARGLGLLAVALLAGSCGDSTTGPPITGTPNQPPTASFSVDISEGAAPLEVQFDGRASADPDGSIQSYTWAFGDGATGSGATTSHTYNNPGSYTPRLTVTDDRGATHTDTGHPITVNSPPGTGENEISGVVWHDANGDGIYDDGEQTIPALVIFLDEDDDGIRDSTEVSAVTNDEGAYVFEGLDANRSYTVTQELTLGWTNTSPGAGDLPAHPTPIALPIIGGQLAEDGEFPFQVALVTNSRFQFCGGSFIARNWVLTAAHCVSNAVANPSFVKVLAGTNDVRSGGEMINVVQVLIHPAYSSDAFASSDIALLELEGEYMYPRIEMLTPDREALADPGTVATVSGWGLTSDGGEASPLLKKLDAEIITNADCMTHLNEDILPVTICAGMLGSSEATCNGDSGGPLSIPFRERWLQVGVVSFGSTICYQPTAFARVSALVDYPVDIIPPERSGSVVVEWNGAMAVTVNFGNFR